MKYRKYLVFMVLLTFFSVNTIYADINYNLSQNDRYVTHVLEDDDTQKFRIDEFEQKTSDIECKELIDPSITELINDALKYPRYIVPGIIIVFGTLDFFKIIISGKEDEMKKAQKTFIKRVVIGVCVFLVPALINVIIWFANIAWQGYSPCPL